MCELCSVSHWDALLNVIGVGLLVVVGSSGDRSAPPTPYVGILVDYDHPCFLFLFATIILFRVGTHLHDMWPGVVRRKRAHSEMETTKLDSDL